VSTDSIHQNGFRKYRPSNGYNKYHHYNRYSSTQPASQQSGEKKLFNEGENLHIYYMELSRVAGGELGKHHFIACNVVFVCDFAPRA